MPTRHARALASLAAAAALPLAAAAEEGLWTFDAFPGEQVERAHGFRPAQAWLDHVRLASVRFARGCSGSFVSPAGLVLTNHHCAIGCLEQLSTRARDLVRDGFTARTQAEELRCPDVEVNQLVRIEDVTSQVRAATRGLSGEAFGRALRAESARLERACATSPALRCDVVPLYHGGLYHLYASRRFQDVRLAFAPEVAAAAFGGDPDNFRFPRYDLDATLLRVYEDGRPARTDAFLPFAQKGPRDGELVFVSGHPGGTDRSLTVAELVYQRDRALPERLAELAELRGLLTGFALLGPEQARISSTRLLRAENGLKVIRGRLEALHDRAFFGGLERREAERRARFARDPAQRDAAAAYDAVARAQDRMAELRVAHGTLERGFDGRLFALARLLLRGAEERGKPDGERLREFRESNLPFLAQEVASPAPVHPELERLLLGHALDRIRERLGPDHPAVRRLLGEASPDEVARRVAEGSRLRDPAVRRALWEGGAAAVAASDDPALALARRVDPAARAVRRQVEDEVEAPVRRAHERIAEARFAAEGRGAYPDATFTLRLSYGQVKGWREGDRAVAPFTTLGGAFERATGRPPFAWPESWLAARPRLDPATPFNLVTTNDILGGNSGSPLVNARGELVGLAFDGNQHSLGGDYGYDPALNRAVAVDVAALWAALERIYGADRLAAELRGAERQVERVAPAGEGRSGG